MPHPTNDPLSVADIDAWAERYARNAAYFWELPVRPSGRFVRWDDVWAADPSAGTPIVNSATLLRRLPDDAFGELLVRLDDFYGAAPGTPWWLWSPWPTPDLSGQGCELIGHPPLMVRLAGAGKAPAAPDLRVVEATDAAGLADWERTLLAGYPTPELAGGPPLFEASALGQETHFWIGYVGDEPVTVAAGVVAEGVVGVQAVATLPHMRGRGYGAAVTHAAALSAPELPAALVSSDLGYRVYAGLGFVPLGHRFTLWMRARGARP